VVLIAEGTGAVLYEADKLAKEGRSVLILVTQIQHGTNIYCMAETMFPHLRVKFVWSGFLAQTEQK